MSSMGKKIDVFLNHLDRKRHIAQQVRGYRRRYAFVLKSYISNPPAEISTDAINSVWNKYGKIYSKFLIYDCKIIRVIL